MANFLTKIIASGIGGLAEQAAGIADRFIQSKDEKAAFMLEIEKLAQAAASELEETMRTELAAKERVLVAELNQGDKFTKRARPTVVYFGLALMALNFTVAPILGWAVQQFSPGMLDPLPKLFLPDEFWYAWGGIVATWSVGRTMERRGSNNNLVQMITGSKARNTISDKINVKSILDD